jgi:hypothetical protein
MSKAAIWRSNVSVPLSWDRAVSRNSDLVGSTGPSEVAWSSDRGRRVEDEDWLLRVNEILERFSRGFDATAALALGVAFNLETLCPLAMAPTLGAAVIAAATEEGAPTPEASFVPCVSSSTYQPPVPSAVAGIMLERLMPYTFATSIGSSINKEALERRLLSSSGIPRPTESFWCGTRRDSTVDLANAVE